MTRRGLLLGLAIVGLGVALYANVLDGAFQFDDQTSILENDSLRRADPRAWWSYWPTRGLTYLTLGLDFQAHRLSASGYHVTNLVIHLLASLAVWWWLCELLRGEERATLAAWVGAAFYLVHPLQTQAVAYIVQRAAALMTLFAILAGAASLAARRRGDSGHRSWPAWSLAYLSGALAMVSKEPAVILPALILLGQRAVPGRTPRAAMIGFALLPLLPLTLALTSSSFGADDPGLTAQTDVVDRGSYLLTQVEVVARYVGLVLVPWGQNLDHDVAWRTSLAEPALLGLLLVHAVLATLGVTLWRRGARRAALGLAWFYVALLPESSLFPIEDAMVEHRVVLALPGVALLVAGLASTLLVRRRTVAVLLFVPWLATLAGLTVARNQLWRDPLSLWSDALVKSPDKARPHMAVGWLHTQAGRHAEARVELERAVEIDPDYGMAWNNLGIVGTQTGDHRLAARAYGEAVRIHPEEAVLWSNLGGAQLRLKEFEAAARSLERAVALSPDLGRLHNDLAIAYAMQRRWDDAEQAIARARELGGAQDWVLELVQGRQLPGD